MKFIPRKTVHQAASMEELLDASKHLPDSNVDVGLITKTSLNKLVAAGDVSPDAASTFYKGAKLFYALAFQYALKRMSFKEDLLVNAGFVHFEERETINADMPVFFVRGIRTFSLFGSAIELEALYREVNDFSLMSDGDLPSDVRQASLVDGGRLRPDAVWGYLNGLVSPDGQPRFPRLSKVTQLVLTIPHSNAAEERVFSMIKKNMTPHRYYLDHEGTLSIIMTIKLEQSNQPDGIKLPPELLESAKTATLVYNRDHR
ncbi:uncharacterized protein LOC5505170 [Nematostella vectensis]|nr:uncharacterized protein LOC5505170 [Nematostella vectensis]